MRSYISGALLFLALISIRPSITEGQTPQGTWKNPIAIDRDSILERHYLSKGMRVLKDSLASGTYQHDKYIVTSSVVVPEGRTVTFPAGTSIFFEPRCAMYVYGKLIAKGTRYRAVQFRPVSRGDMYVEPDFPDSVWVGIFVKGNGRIAMEHCILTGAERTIVTETPCDSSTVRNITVHNSLSSTLVVDWKTIRIPMDSIFSIDCAGAMSKDAKGNEIKKSKRWVPAVLGITGAAIAAGFTTWYGLQANSYAEKVNGSTTYDDAHRYDDKRKTAMTGAVLCGAATAVSLTAGITLTLTLPFKGPDKP
jgi:hypothetical protein